MASFVASVTPVGDFQILRDSAHQLSAAFFGGGLTGAEMNAVYTAIRTYLTTADGWV